MIIIIITDSATVEATKQQGRRQPTLLILHKRKMIRSTAAPVASTSPNTTTTNNDANNDNDNSNKNRHRPKPNPSSDNKQQRKHSLPSQQGSHCGTTRRYDILPWYLRTANSRLGWNENSREIDLLNSSGNASWPFPPAIHPPASDFSWRSVALC